MAKRITLQVDDDLFNGLEAKVPHGFRNHLLAAVLKLIIDAMEGVEPKAILGAVVSGRFKLVEVNDVDD